MYQEDFDKAVKVVKHFHKAIGREAANYAYLTFLEFFGDLSREKFQQACFNQFKPASESSRPVPDAPPIPKCHCGNEYNCGQCGAKRK